MKFHQHGLGPEYGEDHTITDNWNPDLDYQKEYADIYFRVETKGYGYPCFSFTPEDRDAFEKDVVDIFTALGWECLEEAHNGVCARWVHGQSSLYLHPQSFSGVVLKNEVKQVAEALLKAGSFELYHVDLYDTIYDISDEEQECYMSAFGDKIKEELAEKCATKRRSQFYLVDTVCENFAGRFGRKRLEYFKERKRDQFAYNFIFGKVMELSEEGMLVLVEKDGVLYVRRANKTELKNSKRKE